MKKSDPPIVVEQVFQKDPEAVWKAITERDQMVKWFFTNIPDFKAEVGFETEFEVDAGERSFPHRWTVLKVEPERLISYRWRYDNYKGDSHVIFELSEYEGGTKLKLSAVVDEDFDDVPEFQRESCLGGWEYFIQQNLKSYLDGE